MMELEFTSTGALEISVFQRLLDEKGRNPPRLAFWPRIICEQEFVEPPVPAPDPPDPPEPPEPAPFPPPPPVADMPPLQPSNEMIVAITTNRTSGRTGERNPFSMRLFFRRELRVGRARMDFSGLSEGQAPR
jgi:hypothetical protein